MIYLKDNKFEKRVDLARLLGINIITFERWVLQFKENGIEDLLTIVPRKQGSKIITPVIHNGLEERVKDGSNSFKGYWAAQQWVKEQYGVDVKYHTLRGHLMKHFKTKVKRPRKCHIKKDPEAREAFFKTTLYAKGSQK